MNPEQAEQIEQEEEQRPPRRKPVVVKLHHKTTGVRLVGCPAYPTTGIYAGASIEWCRATRGKMTACGKCKWRTA